MTESQEQQALIKRAYLDARTRCLYKISNEGKRSLWEGARFKLEGLKVGMPDICLPRPSGRYHALYIELKRRVPRGKVTKAQQDCIDMLNGYGNYAVAAWGWEAAWEIIEAYLGGNL